MNEFTSCPVCKGSFGYCRTFATPRDTYGFECDGCGRFEISRTAFVSWFEPDRRRLTAMQRSALSHALRSAGRPAALSILTTVWMEAFARDAHLPTPATQAANLVARIGDRVAEDGGGYFIDDVTDAPLVGAFDRAMFNGLLQELLERGIVKALGPGTVPNPRDAGVISGSLYSLALEGWERYEAEKRGRFSGRYGFIAMKFGDPVLDPFVEDVVKPAVHDNVGYSLHDMRKVGRAGVIDNIMRTEIRDAAFLLVDLTHDNSGAYWEAGYAEGLGKPVIYLCERSKFDTAKTHFDTNHCTTVVWSTGTPERFVELLVATLRRSLGIFPNEVSP